MSRPIDDELEARAADLDRARVTMTTDDTSLKGTYKRERLIQRLHAMTQAAALLRACKGRRADYLIEFDNGESISLSSFSGGAAYEGVMGSITLMKEVEDGETTFRKYKAVTDWQSGLQEFTALDPAPDHSDWNAAIEEAAKVTEPKRPRPCDCEGCYCGNPSDAQAVAEWDADNATHNAIRNLKKGPPQ